MHLCRRREPIRKAARTLLLHRSLLAPGNATPVPTTPEDGPRSTAPCAQNRDFSVARRNAAPRFQPVKSGGSGGHRLNPSDQVLKQARAKKLHAGPPGCGSSAYKMVGLGGTGRRLCRSGPECCPVQQDGAPAAGPGSTPRAAIVEIERCLRFLEGVHGAPNVHDGLGDRRDLGQQFGGDGGLRRPFLCDNVNMHLTFPFFPVGCSA